MNTALLLLGALVVSALPTFAQSKPRSNFSYPLISLEEAAHLADTKPIKLHLRDVTVRDALEEIERQTGFPIDTTTPVIDDAQLLDKKLSLDIETLSFKKASEDIFEEAEVQAALSFWDVTGTWQVVSNPLAGETGPLSGDEPFQFRAVVASVQSAKSILYGKTTLPRHDTFNLLMMLLAAPPQLPLLATSQVQLTRADDDKGNSLARPQGLFLFGPVTGSGRALNVDLKPPQPTTRSLSHLEGSIFCLLAKQCETWEVPDVLNTKDTTHQFNIADGKIQLSIKPTALPDSITLDIQVTPLEDGQNKKVLTLPNPLMDAKQYGSMVRLTDANGQTLFSKEAEDITSGPQTKVRMNFRPLIKPAALKEGEMPLTSATLVGPFKLVIKAPTEIVQTEVPFSFTNLPVPDGIPDNK